MRSLKNKTRVLPPDGDFLYGRIKDDDPGVKNGTPVNELLYGDIHQFFERMMALAKVINDSFVPNELPESEYTSFQLNDALDILLGGLRRKQIDIGPWNMNSAQQLNVPHGLSDISKIRKVVVIIHNDLKTLYYDLCNSVALTGVHYDAGIQNIDSSHVNLAIASTSLFFTNSAFDDGSQSRGFMLIDYSL